MAQEALDSMV